MFLIATLAPLLSMCLFCRLAKLQWRHLHSPSVEHSASRQDRDQLLALLPASYRKESGDLGTAGLHVIACVERELDLQRLANIQDWLSIAGLPLPPRALHHQLLLGREVFLTASYVRWPAWRILVQQLDMERIYPNVDRRFIHGELRVSRLNKIYAL
ncbi:hypothetical protein ARSEF4850_002522 [Beauveria asiatica]